MHQIVRDARGEGQSKLLFGEGIAFVMRDSARNSVPCLIDLIALDWIQTMHETKTGPQETFDQFESHIEEMAKRKFVTGRRDQQGRVLLEKDDVLSYWRELGIDVMA